MATPLHDLLRAGTRPGRPGADGGDPSDELRLGDLAAASEHLRDLVSALHAVCRAISSVRADGLAQVYTVGGLGGGAVGAIVRLVDGRAEPDDGTLRRLYAHGFQQADQASARAGRWIDAVKDGWLRLGQLDRAMPRPASVPGRALREYACAATVADSRIVASLGLGLPRGAPPLSPSDRTRLAELSRRAAPVLSAALLLGEARAWRAAVDHLLAGRGDTVFLVSGDGRLIGASPSGHDLLEHRPGLRDIVAMQVQSNPRRRVSFVAARHGLALDITPCSIAGGSPVSIVSVDSPGASMGRRISRRQAELLRWLADGLTNKEIGARMGIASSTVKTMLEHLYRRAGTSGRVKLLRWARPPLAVPPSRGEAMDDEP